ncbi:MAG: response regulator transcription factor, partial [Acidobacteria bacterium]|nr:response regulator transcription factor [Acidobacteriota bacterium]
DVLRGFESGADDYLPKPFELSVLIARLNGLLRRREWFHLAQNSAGAAREDVRASVTDEDRFAFDGRTIDFGRLELRNGDETMRLTLMEAKLLRHLIKQEGRAVSRKSLLEDVWELQEDTDTRAIDNFIVRLRKYIEDEPSNPRHLLTVRGVGYRFVAEPEDD